MLKISLSPLDGLDQCDYMRAFRDDNGREEFPYYIYHCCSLSEFGTEKCKYPGRLCRVKEEDELFEELLGDAVDHALEKITIENMKEGEWQDKEDE
jgi:hypothetical protein